MGVPNSLLGRRPAAGVTLPTALPSVSAALSRTGVWWRVDAEANMPRGLTGPAPPLGLSSMSGWLHIGLKVKLLWLPSPVAARGKRPNANQASRRRDETAKKALACSNVQRTCTATESRLKKLARQGTLCNSTRQLAYLPCRLPACPWHPVCGLVVGS